METLKHVLPDARRLHLKRLCGYSSVGAWPCIYHPASPLPQLPYRRIKRPQLSKDGLALWLASHKSPDASYTG